MKKLFDIREASKISKALSSNSGTVFPLALIVVAVVLPLGALLLSQVSQSVKNDRDYLAYEHCLLTGESAVEECKSKMTDNSEYQGTGGNVVLDDGGIYSIDVARVSDTLREVTIKSQFEKYYRTYSGSVRCDETGKPVSFNILLEE